MINKSSNQLEFNILIKIMKLFCNNNEKREAKTSLNYLAYSIAFDSLITLTFI